MNTFAIGIDIGGTNTVLGLVDRTGRVLKSDKFPTTKVDDAQGFASQIAKSIEGLVLESTGASDLSVLSGVGIGAPNGNYYNGTIEYAPNLAFKGIVNLVQLVAQELKFDRVVLTNDANAAAIGEQIYGGAVDMRNFAMITLGTGVGSGYVVNGELVYGHDGFAGEFGHTMLIPGGRICGCGIPGHVEAYCSATGIKRTAAEMLAYYNDTESELANIPFNKIEAYDVYKAVQNGDQIAVKIFEQTGKWLGMALANLVHNLSPEAIFLFGGPVAAGNLIVEPAKEAMEAHLLPIFRNKIQILGSKLPLGEAPILGASALAWNEFNE